MQTKFTKMEKAVEVIQSHHSVFIHSAAATPKLLVEAMSIRTDSIKYVKFYSIHTGWEALYAQVSNINSFEMNAFFVGQKIRKAVPSGKANYMPMFLSEMPVAFRSGLIP